MEVDYRGYEVTVENLVRLLTGRLPESVPRYWRGRSREMVPTLLNIRLV